MIIMFYLQYKAKLEFYHMNTKCQHEFFVLCVGCQTNGLLA